MKVINNEKIKELDNRFLSQYDSFNDFKNLNNDNRVSETEPSLEDDDSTPIEVIEETAIMLENEVRGQIINKIYECSPAFFERLIVELVVTLGYGGSISDAGKAVGKSNDGGIDGIIKEDILGLDMIYLQAKRWRDTVGSSEVRTFAGSLDGKRAKKGIFITTSKFSKSAYDFVNIIDKKIILIDGDRLSELMYKYNVGVEIEQTFTIKKIDIEYFDE